MRIFLQFIITHTQKFTLQVTFEEIDSDKKRQEMFSVLLEDSENVTQLRAIGQLLLVWPVLAAVELRLVQFLLHYFYGSFR